MKPTFHPDRAVSPERLKERTFSDLLWREMERVNAQRRPGGAPFSSPTEAEQQDRLSLHQYSEPFREALRRNALLRPTSTHVAQLRGLLENERGFFEHHAPAGFSSVVPLMGPPFHNAPDFPCDWPAGNLYYVAVDDRSFTPRAGAEAFLSPILPPEILKNSATLSPAPSVSGTADPAQAFFENHARRQDFLDVFEERTHRLLGMVHPVMLDFSGHTLCFTWNPEYKVYQLHLNDLCPLSLGDQFAFAESVLTRFIPYLQQTAPMDQGVLYKIAQDLAKGKK